MTETTLLKLPYIMPSQAQKHVTHNEALRMLDAIVHIAVADSGRESPPEAPEEGQRHALGPEPTGAFAGQAGTIAVYQDGAWSFFEPRTGWVVWDAAASALMVFDGEDWAPVLDTQGIDLLGVNATADETNRLSVSAPATLLTHEGAGHQLKVNKNEPGDTASLLFQTGWSGRAEMGLAGNDDFAIKVSPDGESWHAGLAIDGASGAVTMERLEIASGEAGESGLAFGDLTSASAPVAYNNRTLTVDEEGAVVLSAASMPRYVMTGAESETTTLRSYDAQVARGPGIYLADANGSIAQNPGSEWSSMGFVGHSGEWFQQFVVTSSAAYFRGGSISNPSAATWFRISQQIDLTHGYVPYHRITGSGAGMRRFENSPLFFDGANGNMGIGTETPDASALFDLAGTSRGFLPPRMTTAQRDAIASPAEGLIVYNLTTHEPQFFDGTNWTGMAG